MTTKMPKFVNCRSKGSGENAVYYAVLADGSEIEWSMYCREKVEELTNVARAV